MKIDHIVCALDLSDAGLLKALLGGVSYKVVRAAPCSVLTVRTRPQES